MTEHITWAHFTAILQNHCLTTLQPSVERPGGNSQLASFIEVEPSRPCIFNIRVAPGWDSVFERPGLDPKSLPFEDHAWALDFHQIDRESRPQNMDITHGLKPASKPHRANNRQDFV